MKLLLGVQATTLGGVRIYERPFFTAYTTSLWIRFLRFVLATIGYAGGLPFGEIGAKMMVTVSNLTGIVDRLEKKKLVSRKRDENDRRVVHVVLTDKGEKLYTSTLPLFEKSAAEIFAALDSGQQKDLSALLRKLHPESVTK
jgi:DNA-binding MarR family transcriptional regulator